jgi:general secretion pathway protein F
MSNGSTITLDQWIAFNDEILALVHAGVPLDRGLSRASGELSGTLRVVAERVAARLSRGESLSTALAGEGGSLPEVYCAVVSAGVRSGRLAPALQGMSEFARGVAGVRRSIGGALLYPLLILVIAYALFVGFVLFVVPRFSASFETFRVDRPWLLRVLEAMETHAVYWVPIVPLLLLGLGVLWVRSNRASEVNPARLYGMLRWVPGLGGVIRSAQAASTADLLALLIEEGTPMPEALRLAGRASGDRAMEADAEALASATERGVALTSASVVERSSIPPLLRWILAGGARVDLVGAIRHAARTYRGLSERRSAAIRVILPMLAIVFVGATATAIYTISIFGPLASFWSELGSPSIADR